MNRMLSAEHPSSAAFITTVYEVLGVYATSNHLKSRSYGVYQLQWQITADSEENLESDMSAA